MMINIYFVYNESSFIQIYCGLINLIKNNLLNVGGCHFSILNNVTIEVF